MKLHFRRRRGESTARADIVRAARQGDDRAFTDMITGVQERLWQVARRLATDDDVAADLVQESLVRAYRSLPRLKDPERFLPWLLRILNHLAADMLGKPGTLSLEALAEAGVNLPAPDRDGPEARADSRHTGEAADRALRAMPLIYRQPLVLRHVLDWPYHEIAEVLGWPLGTVKTRLFRGRELLREHLLREGIHP